ncbi:MAG: hypothetical protein NTW74_18985 [Acidobacteria bacterium]|nr:hypothetical protein [Acidobacteriota bacterium]
MRLLMLLVLATVLGAATQPSDLVPARWPSDDPASLAILNESPINCLLIPEANWSNAFLAAAHAKNITVLALLAPGSPALPRVKRALDLGLDGAVLEGDFPEAEAKAVRSSLTASAKLSVELGLRGRIPLGANAPSIIGTFQGVWAGINPHEDGAAHAAPSGAPWIDTNAGFLRFVRASTDRAFWLSAVPPRDSVVNLSRYLQMISDPAMVGARWVISFEPGFFAKLLAGEGKAQKDLKRINQVLTFFEQNRKLQSLPAFGQLAVVEDTQNGALLSGSVLDMITVKHTPVRPVPFKSVDAKAFDQAKMAVNVDPQSLDPKQQQVLKDFTRSGGTVLTAPPGWRMPVPRPDQIVTDAEEVKKLDQIWKEVNAMMGRRNLGVRLFNVSSMLSNMLGPADGSRVVVYLVNYSDFPVDSVAAHLLGKYSRITIHWPERAPKTLAPYETEDGTGVDIDILESTAILIAEK